MQPISLDILQADKSLCRTYRVPDGFLKHPAAEHWLTNVTWHLMQRLAHVDRKALLIELTRTFNFPGYFGHNWDAAWDCLSELSWSANRLQILHLRIDSESSISENDLSIFVELMNDACNYWATQNSAFCVLIESDRMDSSTLNTLNIATVSPDIDARCR